jgi:hypothetical protein
MVRDAPLACIIVIVREVHIVSITDIVRGDTISSILGMDISISIDSTVEMDQGP